MGRSVFLAAMAGLLVGCAAGILISGLMPAPPAETSSGHGFDEPGVARAAAAPEPRSPDLAGVGTRDASAATETVAPAAAESGAATERRESATSDASLGGSGSIEGRVADSSGAGVAGVVVRTQGYHRREDSEPSQRGRAAPKTKSLDDEIKTLVADYRERSASRAEAVTDGDGHYRLVGLPDAAFELDASVDGYEVTARGGASNIKPGATVNFLATRVALQPVTVLLPDGGAAERVTIEVKAGSNLQWSELWTAADPSLRLTPGSYEIRAVLQSGQRSANRWQTDASSKWERVDLSAATQPGPVVLRLGARCGIRGHVWLGEEMQLTYGIVKQMPVPKDKEPDLQALMQVDSYAWIQSHDNEFSFLDLTPGSYVVGFAPEWSGPILKHAVVEVKDGIVEQDLDLRELDTKGFISATVLAPSGEGIENVNFVARVDNGNNGSWSGGIGAIRRGEGKYWLLPASNGNGSETSRTLAISAHTERYGDKEVEIAGDAKEVKFVFGQPATVDVTIAGYVGSGLEGKLSLELTRDKSRMQTVFYSNGDNDSVKGDGTAHLGPTEAGEYFLEMSLSGANRWERKPIARQKLFLVAGDNHATIGIPVLSRLTVRVQGATTGTVMLRAQSGGNWQRAELKDGVATFENLGEGQYSARYQGAGGSAEATVNLPGQSEITLVPHSANALAVSVTDTAGYLAKRGFQNGDVVVAFDGVEFKDENGLKTALTSLITKPKVVATVLRGNQRVEIEVDGRNWVTPESLGGMMRPTTR